MPLRMPSLRDCQRASVLDVSSASRISSAIPFRCCRNPSQLALLYRGMFLGICLLLFYGSNWSSSWMVSIKIHTCIFSLSLVLVYLLLSCFFPALYYCNPQYHITLKDADEGDDEKKCTLIVSLIQKFWRRKKDKPTSGKRLLIGFDIHRVRSSYFIAMFISHSHT